MKILVQFGFAFTKPADANHINVAFNWMLEDGTLAGSVTTALAYPRQLTADQMNTAAIKAVVDNINSSGTHVVSKSTDMFVLLNSFDFARPPNQNQGQNQN